MSLFGRSKYLPPINIMGGIRIQTSLQGLPIPIVYGRTRIAPNLVWYGDFFWEQVTGSKKGSSPGSGSGKKAGGEYDYGAAVILGLCQGEIAGIGTVWNTSGNLPAQEAQETYTVPPGGGSYIVTNQATFLYNYGVTRGDSYSVIANDYGSPGSITLTGTQQTPMIEGSVSTGHYTQSGPNNATYNFAAGDAGKTMTITYSYGPPLTSGGIAQDPIATVGFTLFRGAQGQAVWAYLTSNHPSQAIGYTTLAYLATPVLDLGMGAALPNFNFEIYGLLPFTGGPGDCDPSVVLNDIFTNALYGCGIISGELASLSAYSNYCVANGLFISPALDQERTAADWIKDIIEATNSEIVESGGLLKIIPYGDTTVVGNGVTFQPATNPIYDLTADSFIRSGTTPPIEVTRPSVQDAYNSVRIEYVDRSNSYNPSIVEAQDLHAINLYKYRPEPQRQYHMFTKQVPAALAASTALARLVYIRNQYKFKLPQSYILLDPMDIVTLPSNLLGMGLLGPSVPSGITVLTPQLLDSGGGVWALGITTTGLLTTTTSSGATAALYINDGAGFSWQIQVTTGGILTTTLVGSGAYPQIFVLLDSSSNAWIVAVTTGGILETAPSAIFGPVSSTPVPVRILTIDEQEDRTLECTAEEFPWGTCGPTLYPKQALLPGGANASAPPGPVNIPIMFEALSRLNNQIGHTIWFGLSGPNANWGGCRIWLSMDGTNYQQVGTAVGQTQMGTLTANLPNTADPDTVDTLSVDLTESFGTLQSYTSAETNVFASLCYVDGELVAYENATLISAFNYNLGTLLRRGVYGSTVGLHTIGSKFMFLNDVVEGYDYDVGLIGSTVYFKFTSFNQSGLVEEELPNVTAYPYTVTGAAIGLLTPAHNTYRATTNPLTAVDAGTSATINIASFIMRVPGIPDIPFGSGAISGLNYGTLYYVYFDDAGFLALSAPAYTASVNQSDALNGAARFFVGSIVTPVAGAQTVGNNDGGTGAQSGSTSILSFIDISTQVLGNGAVANPLNAIDGNYSDYAALTATGNTGTNQAFLNLLNPPALTVPTGKTLTLWVKRGVTNTLNGSGTVGRISLINQLLNTDIADLETYAPGIGASVGIISLVITPSMIPLLANGQIELGASIVTDAPQSSGAMEIDIYMAWITIT